MEMYEQQIETWEISNRVNVYLLEEIDENWLGDSLLGKGRTVFKTFAHIHNIRLMWLKEAGPELMNTVTKIEDILGKQALITNLNASSAAITKLLEKGFAENKIKGFKPHPTAFLGYLIAHEAHHRGQIMQCLKINDHLVSKSLGFALWQWGTR